MPATVKVGVKAGMIAVSEEVRSLTGFAFDVGLGVREPLLAGRRSTWRIPAQASGQR